MLFESRTMHSRFTARSCLKAEVPRDTSTGWSMKRVRVARPVRALQFILIMMLIMAGGCAMVGPDYGRPKSALPSQWSTSAGEGVAVGAADLMGLATWWTKLDDPLLSSLIERSVAGNLDVRRAQAAVRRARALAGITRSGLYPTVDAAGSFIARGAGKNADLDDTTDLYATAFDAAWEIDVFGGKRRSVEAAVADLEASEEDLRDVLVSLLSEVALNYIGARTYQARLGAAEANLASQEETYRLTEWRLQAGLSDELAEQQARYNLEHTKSQIPTLMTGLEGTVNRVSVLVGEPPGSVRKEMETVYPVPAVPQEVAIGVPADVLRQRPDIRRAERQLAAETARVGATQAELYPRFTLSGSIGLEALSINRLFSLSNRVFNYGSAISWPLFDAGNIRNSIEAQSAVQERALISYEASILTALEDVENALVAYREERQRRASLAETSHAAWSAAQLAKHKYEAGLTDFTSVLDAQRSLYAYQDELAQSDGVIASNLVRLYKAFGGGWTTLVPEKGAPPGAVEKNDNGEKR
jgi:outer membrane protein, multidrug efflux system